MWIKELDIRDLGILQGEKMNNIGKGIVVVGGLNRAGKSTLMNAVRYIGYGFRNNNLSEVPQAQVQYYIRAKVNTLDYGEGLIELKGFGKPQFIFENSNKNTQDVYGNIDLFTYKQLFTITLDELRRENIKDNNELQAVLLGAGFRDLINMPLIAERFRIQADNIGGRKGKVNVKQFKEGNKLIKHGLDIKNRALLEIKDYNNYRIEISKIKERIAKIKEIIEERTNEKYFFEFCFHNYENYEEYLKLTNILKEYSFNNESIYNNIDIRLKDVFQEYRDLEKTLKECTYDFHRNVCEDMNLAIMLLNMKEKIEGAYKSIPGFVARAKGVLERIHLLQNKNEKIKYKIKNINENWNSKEDIESINIDLIENDKLQKLSDEYESMLIIKDEREKSLNELNYDIKLLNDKIKEYDKTQEININGFLVFFTAVIILAIILYRFNSILSTALIIGGIFGGAIGFLVKYNLSFQKIFAKKESKIELKEKNKRAERNLCSIKDIKGKLEKNNEEIDEYRDVFKLEYTVSVNTLLDMYSQVGDLKEKIFELNDEERKLKIAHDELIKRIIEYNELINNFNNKSNRYNLYKSKLALSDEIAHEIIKINNDLEYALQIQMVQSKLKDCIKKINSIIGNQIDENKVEEILNEYIDKGKEYREFIKVKREVELLKEKLSYLEKFQNIQINNGKAKDIVRFFGDFSVKSQVKEYYDKCVSEIKDYNDELVQLIEKKAELEEKQRRVLNDNSLIEANKIISNERKNLRYLAEKYAIYRTAEKLTNMLKDEALNKANKTICDQCGEVLEKITGGYIEKIDINNIKNLDFKLSLQDGKIVENSKILSRGTAEQLFLGIRISRIKSIEPPLPVVIDDSLVNFDMENSKNVIKELQELSKRNQIFILTCHSHMVKLIDDISPEAQYWKVENGQISRSSSKELVNHLLI